MTHVVALPRVNNPAIRDRRIYGFVFHFYHYSVHNHSTQDRAAAFVACGTRAISWPVAGSWRVNVLPPEAFRRSPLITMRVYNWDRSISGNVVVLFMEVCPFLGRHAPGSGCACREHLVILIPLAKFIMSAFTPQPRQPKKDPVRPNPVTTSSECRRRFQFEEKPWPWRNSQLPSKERQTQIVAQRHPKRAIARRTRRLGGEPSFTGCSGSVSYLRDARCRAGSDGQSTRGTSRPLPPTALDTC